MCAMSKASVSFEPAIDHGRTPFSTIDTVVVGGGPAGLAAALRLTQHGKQVLLIERNRFERTRLGEVVAPAIREPLSELALWAEFRSLGLRPVSRVDIRWGLDQLRSQDHVLSPYQCAWVLPRQAFDRLLFDAARTRGVLIYASSTVRRVVRSATGWHLLISGLKGRISICCRYLVDATGRQSAFSKMIGRRPTRFDRLVGVGGVVRTEAKLYGDALYVESDVHGWRYSIAIGQNKLACYYMTDIDLIPSGKTARAGWWRDQIRGHTKEAEGVLSETACRLRVSPASTVLRTPVADDGFLSVGDAASALDPLSGMGVLRALRDGIQGADALHAGYEGQRSVLEQYGENVERDFLRHLRKQEAIYESERRWPYSSFWMRRQRGELKDVAIDLDPTINLVRSSDASTLSIVELLGTKFSSRVFETIWASADRSATAAELVSDIRSEVSVNDRDVIAGIQVMLAAGVLNPTH